MNKFLNFAFKMGKIMSSVLLVIVLIIILASGIGFIITNHARLEIPKFSEISTAIQKPDNTRDTQDRNDINEKNSLNKYNAKINRIIKDNDLRSDVHANIRKSIADIDEDLRPRYLNGLAKFYKDGLAELNESADLRDKYLLRHVRRLEGYYCDYYYEQARKNIKDGGTYNKYICLGLLYDYNRKFGKAIREREMQREENIMNNIILGSILGIALIVFTILLFLPVLIKIEENTRPIGEETPNEHNDLKHCEHCGKEIKQNAKNVNTAEAGKTCNKEGELNYEMSTLRRRNKKISQRMSCLL